VKCRICFAISVTAFPMIRAHHPKTSLLLSLVAVYAYFFLSLSVPHRSLSRLQSQNGIDIQAYGPSAQPSGPSLEDQHFTYHEHAPPDDDLVLNRVSYKGDQDPRDIELDNDAHSNSYEAIKEMNITLGAFEPIRREHLPCFLEDPSIKWWQVSEGQSPVSEGFFFLKTHKTGSSTGAGIHLRIARNVAANIAKKQRKLDNHQAYPYSDYVTKSSNFSLVNDTIAMPMCVVRFDHSTAFKMNYGSRNKKKSFLWTIVRDPTQRAVSQFFHFEVSRRNVEPTVENFTEFMLSKRSRTDNYYIRTLSNRKYSPRRNYTEDAMLSLVQDILKGYDFVAITERMDESAVALQMLLGLNTADILYLNAKGSGGYDAGGFQGKCVYITPKVVTPGMKQFLRESHEWNNRVKWDQVLYRAANKSLDLTIDRLGRDIFQDNLEKFQQAQALAKEICLGHNETKIRFPCSPSRNGLAPLRHKETDCLWKDSACGSSCLDQVSVQLGLW
jgi:hypothetical protein